MKILRPCWVSMTPSQVLGHRRGVYVQILRMKGTKAYLALTERILVRLTPFVTIITLMPLNRRVLNHTDRMGKCFTIR